MTKVTVRTVQPDRWSGMDGWSISIGSSEWCAASAMIDAISIWCEENGVENTMNGFSRFWFESEADANLVYLRFK